MTRQSQHRHSYMLTAGESNAEGLMPFTLLVERIIETATEHANMLGIGYEALIKKNIGWVLSRMSVEMNRYPRINEHYTLTTWIETYNHFFSERNFCITTHEGEVLGYARTIWAAMDFEKRSLANLNEFEKEAFPIANLSCPMAKTPKIPAPAPDSLAIDHKFRYCDLDFNRHVNTVRYIEFLMNQWSLSHYDCHTVQRFDIVFHQECHYDETVKLCIEHSNDNRDICSIFNQSGVRAIAAAITWQKQ